MNENFNNNNQHPYMGNQTPPPQQMGGQMGGNMGRTMPQPNGNPYMNRPMPQYGNPYINVKVSSKNTYSKVGFILFFVGLFLCLIVFISNFVLLIKAIAAVIFMIPSLIFSIIGFTKRNYYGKNKITTASFILSITFTAILFVIALFVLRYL